MKKTKIFLDTSVISYLYKPELPDREAETWALWECLITGMYDVVLSDAVIKEIDRYDEPKRQKLYNMLAKIDYTEVTIDNTIEDIADEIIRLKILKERNRDDCRHIGCTIFANCDYLISWNFNDLANVKTNKGVRAITLLLNYPSIEIVSPFNLKFREEEK
jgi:predicted nucleic acid-binding protein